MLSWIFIAVVAARRHWLRSRQRPDQLSLPVIVIGNITVGGSGKTPFVIWLVERLREWGWRPGIVSRGYGGRPQKIPRVVTGDSSPQECGDEPVMMARRLNCPLVVCPDRLAAAQALVRLGTVDIILSDDGLQHYRLPRDLEIAVVDGAVGLGNGHRLPAGPLREAPSRLASVDLVVIKGHGWSSAPQGSTPPVVFRLEGAQAHALSRPQVRPLTEFVGQTVHAVAGIGTPARFFGSLSRLGLRLIMHPFPDHHRYKPADLAFGDAHPVLMTEKDAIKCARFKDDRLWHVPVNAEVSASDTARVQELISKLKRKIT